MHTRKRTPFTLKSISMKSIKATLITAFLIASMLPALLKAQTVDQGTIQTTNDPVQWTTSQVQTPWVNNPYVARALEVNFNDINSSNQNGFWHAYDISENLKALNFDVSGNVSGTWDAIPDSIAGQILSFKYFVSDTAGGRHGVGAEMKGRANRYEIEALINYSDNGVPMSVEFKLPDYFYQVFMDADTSLPVDFEPASGYDLDSDPLKLDSILVNINDAMNMSNYDLMKSFMEQMNETSPYSGAGSAMSATLENISEGGISNPFNPASITFTMLDHFQSDYGKQPQSSGMGPPPDDNLETKTFETDMGPVTVKYFMPALTVTHPGAEVVNNYEVTTLPGEIPEFTVDAGGLDYTISTSQINDSVFDVAVAVKTPEGVADTYNIQVDIDGIPVNTNTPQAPAFNSVGMPNPFNTSTTLRYTLGTEDMVDIVLYDVNGREIQTLFQGKQAAGVHDINIDGSGLAAGVYIVNTTSQSGGSSMVKFVKQD